MGSQPISIQLRKILQENLVGNCCGKMLPEILAGKLMRENLAGKCSGKFLRENVVQNSCGKSCGKLLRENLVGNGGGEKANLRKTVIGGNLAFGIG